VSTLQAVLTFTSGDITYISAISVLFTSTPAYRVARCSVSGGESRQPSTFTDVRARQFYLPNNQLNNTFIKLPKSFRCLSWFVKSVSVCLYVCLWPLLRSHFSMDLDETLEINFNIISLIGQIYEQFKHFYVFYCSRII
jgi:hypothetical protein